MSDPKDDLHEHYRKKDEFYRDQDQRRDNLLDDQARERARRKLETEEGWKALRHGDTMRAIAGIAGPEAAVDYARLSESRMARPDPTYVLPEHLPREELVRKIHTKRDEVIDRFQGAWDLHDEMRQRWIEEFSEIELFDPGAEKRVENLRARVDRYRENLSILHGGRMDLALASGYLGDMKDLCAVYQQNFGSGA